MKWYQSNLVFFYILKCYTYDIIYHLSYFYRFSSFILLSYFLIETPWKGFIYQRIYLITKGIE